MTLRISLLTLLLMLAGCGARSPESRGPTTGSARCQPGEAERWSEDVEVSCVAEGVWVFVALAPEDFVYPRYPANGLLLESDGRSVLVDTGWRDAHAESLIAFARERGHPIAAAMATHAHDDRVGGVAALQAAGIPVFATAETIALAEQAHVTVPDHVLVPGALGDVEWLFPGAGHSPDNLVVWHPSSRTLFGGCLIKGLDATSLGHVSEADPVAWPRALDAVREAYPDPARVVPGHGAIGGMELLAHTASLLRAESTEAVAGP